MDHIAKLFWYYTSVHGLNQLVSINQLIITKRISAKLIASQGFVFFARFQTAAKGNHAAGCVVLFFFGCVRGYYADRHGVVKTLQNL